MSFETLSEANGVLFGRYSDQYGSRYVVADSNFTHYRLTFALVSESPQYTIGLDAEWSDDNPGQLANFTYDKAPYCALDDEVKMTDEGVLIVMARPMQMYRRQNVEIKFGFSVALPDEFIEPVREALAHIKRDLQAKVAYEGKAA